MEYSYRPRPANKNATWLLSVLGLGAILLFTLGMANVLGMRSLWQFAALLFAVGALFVFLRYFSTYYIYTVTEEWGTPTLVVSHVQGKRRSTHCRLTLSHLLRVVEVADPESPEGRAALADFMSERVRYSYLATLGKCKTQIVYGREGGTRFAIRLEADAAFIKALLAATARAGSYTYDEEVPADDE
ncbi:MAG: hypothetical protein IJF73_03300 [Clostridia bacterium]|nr:hypothetical protein [Clostridia bacterium]